MKTRIILFLFSLLTINSLYAQTNDLTEEVKQTIADFAKQRVDQFNDQLTFIAGKKKYSDEVKDKYISQALKNFIGGGKAYRNEETGQMEDAPTMEVSSINRRTGFVSVNQLPTETYLQNLKNLNYTEVTVTSSSAHFITEFKQVSDNEYETVMSYVQIFVGKRDNRIVYKDKTEKHVRVHIKKVDLGNGLIKWNVLLGDIQVKATK